MYCDKVTNNKTKIWKSMFVWGFVLITLIATTAAGANASTGEQAQIIEKFEVEEEFGVRKALAMLGSLCGKNIVPSPNVDGVLAFRSLKNITFEEAMDAILGENFRYEQVGNLIKVYTKDEYKKIKEDPARMVRYLRCTISPHKRHRNSLHRCSAVAVMLRLRLPAPQSRASPVAVVQPVAPVAPVEAVHSVPEAVVMRWRCMTPS